MGIDGHSFIAVAETTLHNMIVSDTLGNWLNKMKHSGYSMKIFIPYTAKTFEGETFSFHDFYSAVNVLPNHY